MNNFEKRGGPEIKEREKVYWEHPCQSCKFEGSTAFTEEGIPHKMDVYSCTDHLQPGIYGSAGTKFQGERVVVRYAPSANDSIGEISFDRTRLDMESLRSRVQNRRGRTDHTPPAQIAIGKVL